jgi:SAM-dependent methyltransferase
MFKKNYSDIYNKLYVGKPYLDEVEFILSLAQELGVEISKVLDLGCGTGSHAEVFVEKGIHVTGVERSREMIKNCFLHANFQVIHADIVDYKPQVKFDLVVSLFHVISYLQSLEDILRLFRHVSSGLKEEGLFIFDAWYTPAVLSIGPSSRSNIKEMDCLRLERVSHPINKTEISCVEVNFETNIYENNKLVEVITESHTMRHYSIPELQFVASIAGLELVDTRELLTNISPSQQTWAVLFTFKKIKDESSC